ncbi:MAG: M48 family metalloprotease, partial [Patescibacteria group bacterium]|nr:M48 family metalloprotease [Patescibacteria group bacterium]
MKKDKTLILSQQTDEQEDEEGEEKPKTNEGFSSYIESLPKSTRQTARCEKILHKIFYAHLPEKHPTHQLIQGIADRIFKEFNLSEEEFTLKIFQSDIPDVHVQFAEKELRLSSGFLELVEGDSDKIASVLAHEIGHVALAHFKTNDSETGKDHDPISEHIQHYEEEYQADRASTIITNRLGIPPKTLAETLQIIGVNATKKVKKIKEGDDAWDTKRQMWILNTHPHTRRRAMAIERDSRNLPRYPRTLRQQNIPIPKPKSFQGEPQDVDLWRVEYFNENLERRGPFSDCVWENVTPPKYEPKEVVSMRSIRSKNKEPDDYLTGDPLKYLNIKSEEIKDEKSGKNILLDFIPEEVNSWVEKNNGDCPVWWYQAMNSLDSEDAYHDLAADISEYSLETTLQLLNNCQPEYYILQKLDYDTRVEERDYIRETATQVALYGDEDFPPEFLITSSLLVRNWLEKDPSLKTLEGFSAIPAFLRSFIETHGTPLPYTGAQFFLQLEHFFTDAKTDQEREQLTVLYREYEKELSMHSSTVNSEAPHIMPTFAGYLTEHHPNEFFRIKGAQGKTSAHYELPNEIKNIQKQEVTKQEARELLKLIPSNYTPKNMGHIALSLAQDWEERGPKHEYSLEYASKMLSEEEFNERYFGRDRTAYEKTPYGEAEKSITELDDIAFLWNQSGYEKMLKDVPAGAPRLNALLETYPARCTNREKLISRILEWPELENIDDILTTQSQISECTNIEVLFALSDAFINPLLDISVGQQLWKIYQQDPEYFLTQVPVEHNQRVAEETADTPDSALSSELKAILLTHRHPTFVRDELLRTLVDKAPDKTSTLAIAGWYTEPPPGILRPRESGSVMVSETILDVMQRRDKLEKQELLLYFLGHRTFYSSIDKEHF